MVVQNPLWHIRSFSEYLITPLAMLQRLSFFFGFPYLVILSTIVRVSNKAYYILLSKDKVYEFFLWNLKVYLENNESRRKIPIHLLRPVRKCWALKDAKRCNDIIGKALDQWKRKHLTQLLFNALFTSFTKNTTANCWRIKMTHWPENLFCGSQIKSKHLTLLWADDHDGPNSQH